MVPSRRCVALISGEEVEFGPYGEKRTSIVGTVAFAPSGGVPWLYELNFIDVERMALGDPGPRLI